MKILKIFGLVVAVHAAVFMFIFAIPGCRSTGKQKAVAPAGDAFAQPGNDTVMGAPTAAPSDTGSPAQVLFSPTRPGTAAAASIEAQPAADVQPVSAYTVVKGDNLWSIAKKNGTTVKALTAANNLQANSPLHLGQKLIIPGKPLTKAAASAAVTGAETLSYTVKSGDTLAGIARHAGTTASAIKSLNKLKSDVLRVGQVLVLSSGVSSAPAASAEAAAPAAPGSSMTHVVKAGDTLAGIAHKYQVKIGDIAAANNIADPTKIRIGQKLKIPGWQAPVAEKAAAPSAPASVPSFTPASVPDASPVSPAAESPLFSSPAADDSSPLVTPAPDSSSGAPVIKIEGASAAPTN